MRPTLLMTAIVVTFSSAASLETVPHSRKALAAHHPCSCPRCATSYRNRSHPGRPARAAGSYWTAAGDGRCAWGQYSSDVSCSCLARQLSVSRAPALQGYPSVARDPLGCAGPRWYSCYWWSPQAKMHDSCCGPTMVRDALWATLELQHSPRHPLPNYQA